MLSLSTSCAVGLVLAPYVVMAGTSSTNPPAQGAGTLAAADVQALNSSLTVEELLVQFYSQNSSKSYLTSTTPVTNPTTGTTTGTTAITTGTTANTTTGTTANTTGTTANTTGTTSNTTGTTAYTTGTTSNTTGTTPGTTGV